MIIRKKFRFEAAHRLPEAYSGRCRGLHGHSYTVEVFIEGDVDRGGMVVDFGKVKRVIGKFIDRFDHSVVLWHQDDLANDIHKLNSRWVKTPYPPTAEMMAAHFFWFVSQVDHRLGLGVSVKAVRIQETETGWAECDRILDNVYFGAVEFSDELLGEEG